MGPDKAEILTVHKDIQTVQLKMTFCSEGCINTLNAVLNIAISKLVLEK